MRSILFAIIFVLFTLFMTACGGTPETRALADGETLENVRPDEAGDDQTVVENTMVTVSAPTWSSRADLFRISAMMNGWFPLREVTITYTEGAKSYAVWLPRGTRMKVDEGSQVVNDPHLMWYAWRNIGSQGKLAKITFGVVEGVEAPRVFLQWDSEVPTVVIEFDRPIGRPAQAAAAQARQPAIGVEDDPDASAQADSGVDFSRLVPVGTVVEVGNGRRVKILSHEKLLRFGPCAFEDVAAEISCAALMACNAPHDADGHYHRGRQVNVCKFLKEGEE